MGADQRTFCTKHGQQGDYYSKCGYCVAEDEHAKVVELTALVQKLSGGNGKHYAEYRLRRPDGRTFGEAARTA